MLFVTLAESSCETGGGRRMKLGGPILSRACSARMYGTQTFRSLNSSQGPVLHSGVKSKAR